MGNVNKLRYFKNQCGIGLDLRNYPNNNKLINLKIIDSLTSADQAAVFKVPLLMDKTLILMHTIFFLSTQWL